MITAPQSITASRLRLILSITLALLIIAGGGIFYLGYTGLSKIALETGERAASAKQSETAIQRLETLQAELKSKKDIIAKASRVAANSRNYAYQDRLINDLTVYANRAGLTIQNINFTDPATKSSAGDSKENGTSAASAGNGLKKATVDIALQNPVNYRNLLNFLHYIEQNLTKLKINRVGMTKSEGGNVTIDTLNLEVYLE